MIICDLIETIVSVFVNIFATGYVLGRVITHVLVKVCDVLLEIGSILASFAVTFYEDAKIFMLDIEYQYGHIIKMLNNGINNSLSDVSRAALAIGSSIQWMSEQTKSEVYKICHGILDMLAHSAVGVRNWIVLIGNSVWMLLMCIPNLIALIACNIFGLAKYMGKSIVDTIKLSGTIASDSVSVTVIFFTSVPLQSVCGLISIYFIIKYRRVVFWLLQMIYRAIARIIILRIFARIFSVFEFLFDIIIPIRNFLPNLWRLSSIQYEYPDIPRGANKTGDQYGPCVICQDKIKTVVLLPCRHLCLCQDCFRQLRRYRRECPMCRRVYEHSIQVYA